MITTILVALDHTERAQGVLRLASEVAERFDAAMYLLRAITVPQDFPAAASNAGHRDELPAYLVAEATQALRELAASHPRALAHEPVVVVGPPARAIMETAERLGADLIVIGAHGLHGLDYLLGTVTGRVSVRARCHVLVAHDH